MSHNNNQSNNPAVSPSHSLNVQHLERLHYKSRENDYSPRSLVLGGPPVKPPEYHESCRKLSSSSATATQTQTDSANNSNTNKHNKQPGSGIRNPHYHSTYSKYTVNGKSPPATTTSSNNITTINFHDKQINEVKPMKTHQSKHHGGSSNKQTNAKSNERSPPIERDLTNSQQRTLVNLFQLYVIIVIVLALVYAIYQFSAKPHQHHQITVPIHSADPLQSGESSNHIAKQQHQTLEQFLEFSGAKQSELEQKLQLMQKYIELMANDLQDTKERLREREKCHCSRPCTSPTNMTQQYADGASWQQQCDICSCQSGKVTCQPVKCPQLANCDEPQQVPGQCCPVCLKKCKYNQMNLKHGQTFKPNESPAKECTCLDGLIKCAPLQLNAIGSRQTMKPNRAIAIAASIEKRTTSSNKRQQIPIRQTDSSANNRLEVN